MTTLATGARLAQYEIVEPIGSGGMGEVYRARDPRLDRDVAIKVMAPHAAADPEMRRRFETEARAIAALSHPSILAIHELAIVNDTPVAVMELLQGGTLRARLKQGAIPWREAVQIATAIADGLAAAHARGVIHRDLKPENVFLTNDGAVKILDFGLALRRIEMPLLDGDGPTMARTAPHVVLGTLGYMSPEQVSGDRVDGRSDIFALGCVLYEMLTGRALFAGSTPQEIVARSDARSSWRSAGARGRRAERAAANRVALPRANAVASFRVRKRPGGHAARPAQRVDVGGSQPAAENARQVPGRHPLRQRRRRSDD